MPIKLSDLTCDKCIFSYFTEPSALTGNGYWNCRKHRYPVSIDKNYWCGEGKWATWNDMEPFLTRETYFVINIDYAKTELIDPHHI